jgi:hypothetical protein
MEWILALMLVTWYPNRLLAFKDYDYSNSMNFPSVSESFLRLND